MNIWERLVALFRRKPMPTIPSPNQNAIGWTNRRGLKQGLPTLASRNIGARERGVGRNCRLALPTGFEPVFQP
jgi:hypothetical protein